MLDTKPYTDEANRSWIFRTIGWGHDAMIWKDMVSALRLVGYDWVLSIEHEDSLMSFGEGFCRAVAFLQDCTHRRSRRRRCIGRKGIRTGDSARPHQA